MRDRSASRILSGYERNFAAEPPHREAVPGIFLTLPGLGLAPDFAAQETFGEFPIPRDRFWRHIQRFRRVFHAQAAEIAQLDHFGLARIRRRQRLERIIERDDFLRRSADHRESFIDFDHLDFAAALGRFPAAGMVHQNVTHRFGRDAEKMRAAVPILIGAGGEFEISLMDDRCCLERVSGALLIHVMFGDFM